jgi:biotin transport system substrate-specific component
MTNKSLSLAPPLRIASTLVAGVTLSLVLVASAKFAVPFWPVPMTLQTLAVLAIGGVCGWRIGVTAMLAYLAEGAAGLPVFAGTPAHGIGLAYMAGPTGGYLLGLLLAVAFAGWAGPRFARRPAMLGLAMLAAVGLNYLPGVAWLATFTGWHRALALGVMPFVAADAVKAAIATCLVLAVRRRA